MIGVRASVNAYLAALERLARNVDVHAAVGNDVGELRARSCCRRCPALSVIDGAELEPSGDEPGIDADDVSGTESAPMPKRCRESGRSCN